MQSTLRRRGTYGIAGAVAAVVLALIGAGTGSAAGRYSDPTGDSRGGPDITGVAVVSDPNGQILLTISATGIQPNTDTSTLVLLDTDANAATGAPDTLGSEYVLEVDEKDRSWYFGHWTGGDWDWDTPSSSVRISGSGAGYVLSVNARELGGTQSFNFWVRSVLGGIDAGQFDDAPDNGLFNYTLTAGGPDIRSVQVHTTPSSGPRAGKRFTVTPTGVSVPTPLVSSDGTLAVLTPQPESYRCAARLGTRTLRGGGVGGCTFAVPRTANGKRLTVAVTVVYQGASKTFSFVYRVRK